MPHNAYILDWTMERFPELIAALRASGLAWVGEGDGPHIRVSVPLDRLDAFASLCQAHLNAPCNYVDLQYPEERLTVLVFRERVFRIRSREQNAVAQHWAMERGLPATQAEWGRSF
jgi:hypothetical protein